MKYRWVCNLFREISTTNSGDGCVFGVDSDGFFDEELEFM